VSQKTLTEARGKYQGESQTTMTEDDYGSQSQSTQGVNYEGDLDSQEADRVVWVE